MSFKKPISNLKPLQYFCREKIILLDFLLKTHGSTATKLKKIAGANLLMVNENLVKDLKIELNVGDVVSIKRDGVGHQNKIAFEVLFEDEFLIAVNKPAGLLTVADESGSNNLFKELKASYKNEIFICHRLDREVSGAIVFGKSKEVQITIENEWSSFQKKYRARVEGIPEQSNAILTHYLFYSGPQKVIVSDNERPESVKAITEYIVLSKQKNFADLEIKLHTGKKNQIRAQLAYIGHPIVGDVKFGALTKMGSRIALHSHQIVLMHPVSGGEITITAPIPF